MVARNLLNVNRCQIEDMKVFLKKRMLLLEYRFHKGGRVKWLEVVDTLTQPDEIYRNRHLPGNGDYNPAPGGAVQLG